MTYFLFFYLTNLMFKINLINWIHDHFIMVEMKIIGQSIWVWILFQTLECIINN